MLQRKILDPIRFVFPEDTAVASNGAAYGRYLDEVCNFECLEFVEGEKPTVFVLGQLTHRQRIARDAYEAGLEQLAFTVRCGLIRVENYWIERPDGSMSQVEQPERKEHGKLGEIVSEEWMDRAGLTCDQIGQLAIAILAISEAKIPLLKSCAIAFGGGD